MQQFLKTIDLSFDSFSLNNNNLFAFLFKLFILLNSFPSKVTQFLSTFHFENLFYFTFVIYYSILPKSKSTSFISGQKKFHWLVTDLIGLQVYLIQYNCKWFILKIVTWSYNCYSVLFLVIRNNMIVHKKWFLLNRSSYFKPYNSV